jgi:hypothetical protein
MFASLVVAIPLEHTGGDVQVTHLQDRKVFKTDSLNPDDIYWMAW